MPSGARTGIERPLVRIASSLLTLATGCRPDRSRCRSPLSTRRFGGDKCAGRGCDAPRRQAGEVLR